MFYGYNRCDRRRVNQNEARLFTRGFFLKGSKNADILRYVNGPQKTPKKDSPRKEYYSWSLSIHTFLEASVGIIHDLKFPS